jgi:predicted ATPase
MKVIHAPRLRFPILHRFEIAGYQLFPGRRGTGFAYEVKKGVTVIAGINGLGKTTLLNALFRDGA